MSTRHPTAIYRLRLLHRPTLRQQDLAVRIGVGQGKVSEYESGVIGEGLSLLRAMEIAVALDVSVEQVFLRGLGGGAATGGLADVT